MITFKAIIIPGNRRKDGTWPVVIRVTFHCKSRRLPTTMACTQADLTRSLKIKNPTILNRTDELIARMREAVKDLSPFDLESRDVDWVVQHIKDTLTKETFHLDFFEWSEKYILTKKDSTRKAYYSALNTFERFLGKRSIDINAISRPLLLDFMEMVESEPWMHWNPVTKQVEPSQTQKIPKGASTRHLAKLEHLFNAAKEKYNDEDSGRILIPRSPFSKITKVYPVSNGQGNLGEELMQKIILAKVDNAPMRTALDVFILSFGLMGANMADLYNAKPVKGDTWIYNRQKTRDRRSDKAEMRVAIPHQLLPYLERLRGKGPWWLNGLHQFSSTKDWASARVNRCLRKWCEDNGVDVFTFYAARHTWASLARRQGVDKSTIDDCLGHKGSFQVADIYAEKAWSLIQEANQKVISLFTWEDQQPL